jgi:hypothetical protein
MSDQPQCSPGWGRRARSNSVVHLVHDQQTRSLDQPVQETTPPSQAGSQNIDPLAQGQHQSTVAETVAPGTQPPVMPTGHQAAQVIPPKHMRLQLELDGKFYSTNLCYPAILGFDRQTFTLLSQETDNARRTERWSQLSTFRLLLECGG